MNYPSKFYYFRVKNATKEKTSWFQVRAWAFVFDWYPGRLFRMTFLNPFGWDYTL